MAEDYKQGRDTELVLPPGVFAYVQDNTKGNINTYCGPYKSSLSNTDQLVTYNADSKKFVPARDQATAIQTDILVPKGSYVVLENPASTGKQPEAGKTETMTVGSLKMGQIENLPGPKSFALWPGQVATVIKGHHLRSNQYLMVRVYDDEAAKANWDKSVVKGATTDDTTTNVETTNVLGINKDTLVTGQLLVIKGTAVAFYIPPTGVEVLTDENSKYIRDAVTLERLEYAILLGESGNKEYKIGPDVVFPTPTQQFYTKDGARKFRAEELQPTTGMHIKVIADYVEGGVTNEDGTVTGGTKYTAGQELFITGEDQPIYYPREEHSTIMYGGFAKSFAVAIPAGEGRYVLNRETGEVNLVEGPRMFLPDPRKEVVVRRALSDSECELYYPGNAEVLDINRELRDANPGNFYGNAGGAAPAAASYRGLESALEDTRMSTRSFMAASYSDPVREAVGKGLAGDVMNRGTKYTPPRTITLNTKYDGAVRISPWSGFAVQVVNSKGDRRTVVGPQTVLLQYDEGLERLSLSKGKPKNNDTRMPTAYLRYISNPVSDIISLKTQDLVNVDIQVKYLVRFDEADKNKWFSVDNYVQYMVDHLRSLIGNAVRNIGVQEFYSNAANILRDTVLGTKATTSERPLKHFSENGMTVYDLELITITVRDNEVANMLSKSRQDILSEAIELERTQNKLTLVKGKENVQRQIETEYSITAEMKDKIAADAVARSATNNRAQIEAENAASVLRKKGEQDAAEIAKITQALYLETTKAADEHKQAVAQQELDRKISLLVEEAKASDVRMKSVQPALVEALVGMAQEGMFEKIAEHLAPLSIVRGESLSGTLTQMFAGTPLEGMVSNIANLSKVKAVSK
jgi:major vault protein